MRLSFRGTFLCAVFTCALLIAGCAKQQTVIMEYDQPYNIISADLGSFPGSTYPGVVHAQSGSNGLWIAYDLVRVSNTGKDAVFFSLERDRLTTQERTHNNLPQNQSFAVPDEIQKNVVTLPATLAIKPQEKGDVKARLVLFVPVIPGTIAQLKQVGYVDLKYNDPTKSVLIVRRAPVVEPQNLDPATWPSLKP